MIDYLNRHPAEAAPRNAATLTEERMREIVREENLRLLMASCVLSRWTRQGIDVVDGLGLVMEGDAYVKQFDVYYQNDLNRVYALMKPPDASAVIDYREGR